MWADVQTHQLSMDFKNAAIKEYDSLVHWGVFQPVSCWNTSSKSLPLKWVFTYKLSEVSAPRGSHADYMRTS